MGQNNFGKSVPSRLWAGVQTARSGSQHNRLQQHAVVQQRALTHHAVYGEHQAHRGIKKLVIALVLRMHGVFVAFHNAQQTIQAPAVFTPAVNKRAHPLCGVVVIGLSVLLSQTGVGAQRIMRGAHFIHQTSARLTLQHIHLPRLGVGA